MNQTLMINACVYYFMSFLPPYLHCVLMKMRLKFVDWVRWPKPFHYLLISYQMCIDELCMLFIRHNKKDIVLIYDLCDIHSLGII